MGREREGPTQKARTRARDKKPPNPPPPPPPPIFIVLPISAFITTYLHCHHPKPVLLLLQCYLASQLRPLHSRPEHQVPRYSDRLLCPSIQHTAAQTVPSIALSRWLTPGPDVQPRRARICELRVPGSLSCARIGGRFMLYRLLIMILSVRRSVVIGSQQWPSLIPHRFHLELLIRRSVSGASYLARGFV